MGHQMANRDRPLRRPRVVGPIGSIEPGQHGPAFEAGNVFRDRVIEPEFPRFDEHHRGHRRDRFRHRRDSEQGVRRHVHAARDVQLAGGSLVEHTLTIDHERDDTRDIAALNCSRKVL